MAEFNPQKIPVADFPYPVGAVVRGSTGIRHTVTNRDGYAFLACCHWHEQAGRATGWHPATNGGRLLDKLELVEGPRTPNVELLRMTLAHVRTHPGQWDQGHWSTRTECGTAYCFAGWTAVLTGARFVPHSAMVTPPGADRNDLSADRHVADYAAQVLGLPRPHLEWGEEDDEPWPVTLPDLFMPHNSLADLDRMVGELCGAPANV